MTGALSRGRRGPNRGRPSLLAPRRLFLLVVLGMAVPTTMAGCDPAAPKRERAGSPSARATPSPERAPSPATGGAPAAAAPTPVAAPVSPPLVAEQRDRDPASDMVTIKIVVEPPRQARVFWGAKELGLAPLELQRPRGSGPLDLILRAPGYLTLHTRAFTDRDDKISVRLTPESDAPRMLGYRPP